MVKRLRLRVPIRIDQTLSSYVGELAAMNFQPSTDDFCRDMGTTLHEVAMGVDDAISTIASVSGNDLQSVDRAAFRLGQRRSFIFRGQTLTQQARTPMLVRFCVKCLQDDIADARATGMPHPSLHAYGRPIWHAAQYRTCVRHGLQLAAIKTAGGHRQYDFFGAVYPHLDRLEEVSTGLIRRPASDLERHLERRMQEKGDGYLDGIGFSAAARFCEVLGAVALFGRRPPHLGFNDAQWHQAGAAGYQIASGGPGAIVPFLTDLRDSPGRDSRGGPRNDWGIVFDWLEDTRDPELEPLLELARDLAETNYPTAPGKRVLGRLVKERKVHSISSASIESGLHFDALRRQLAAAGVIENEPDTYPNHILFAAEPNQILLDRLSRGVSAIHARERINCDRQVFDPLVQAGLISPIVKVSSAFPLFDTADLDAFAAALVANAVPYDIQPGGMETIATTRMKVTCGHPEIVSLVLSGKLKRVGRLTSETAYASVLVDPAEVALHVRGEALDGIIVTRIAADLGVPHAGMVKMLDVQLPTVWRMHPRRRCPQQIVDDAVYKEFKSRYVSLRDLSRAAGVNARRHAVALRKSGILPEPGFPDRVHLYLRKNLV